MNQGSTGSLPGVNTLKAVSSGEDWFEWTIQRRCQSVQICVVGRRGYIKELLLNERVVPVKMETDPECCTLLTLERDFMLSPQDKLRIVTKAPRGAKISAHLKFEWPS